MEKKIFIAATRQNDGKTVISLGLLLALKKYVKNVGFIKPIGQKYLLVDGAKVDKDAVLVKKVCGFKEDLKDMNPIAVEEGFTRKYLDNPDPSQLRKKIKRSYEKVAKGKDIIVIEGTGHAGVGSIFDLNNAEVARILDSPVIIISIGGIGKPFDEISLNISLFREKKVEVKGVIINKVIPEKKQFISKYLRKGFDRVGIKLLGVIPFVPLLTEPDLGQICEAVNGKIICGFDKIHQKIKNVIVGAMTPRHALDYFKPNSLIVTPGDREDIILAGITCHSGKDVKGFVLTGGLYPHKTILSLIKKFDIPTIIAPKGTYETASAIHELVVKLTENDYDKIEMAGKLVEENIDIEEILK